MCSSKCCSHSKNDIRIISLSLKQEALEKTTENAKHQYTVYSQEKDQRKSENEGIVETNENYDLEKCILSPGISRNSKDGRKERNDILKSKPKDKGFFTRKIQELWEETSSEEIGNFEDGAYMECKCEGNKRDEPDANKTICQEKVCVNSAKEGMKVQVSQLQNSRFLAIDVYAVWMKEKHSHMIKIPIDDVSHTASKNTDHLTERIGFSNTSSRTVKDEAKLLWFKVVHNIGASNTFYDRCRCSCSGCDSIYLIQARSEH